MSRAQWSDLDDATKTLVREQGQAAVLNPRQEASSDTSAFEGMVTGSELNKLIVALVNSSQRAYVA